MSAWLARPPASTLPQLLAGVGRDLVDDSSLAGGDAAEFDFGDFILDAIANEMMTFSGQRHAPIWGVAPPSMEKFDTRQVFRIIDLTTPTSWDDLYNSIADGVYHNRSPWNRCMSVLRGMDAHCCVIEFNYVCLDLRGEIAAFNAQLDTPVERATIRLHFFSKKLATSEVSSLTQTQTDSYLGYVVCRRPGSPRSADARPC